MADDIHCPYCNKLNPAGATTCLYCLSSLTDGVDDTDEWLSRLRDASTAQGIPQEPASEPVSPVPSQPESQADDEVPGWLEKIRERNRSEQETPENLDWLQGESEEPKEETPDWLASLQASTTDSESEQAVDWSSGMGEGAGSAPESEALFLPGEEPVNQADLLPETPAEGLRSGQADWLSSVPENPMEGLSTGNGETPSASQSDDWLSGLGVTPTSENAFSEQDLPAATEPDSGTGEVELPDWLGNEQPVSPTAPGAAEPGEGEIPDWLRSLEEDTVTTPTSTGFESADWTKADAQLESEGGSTQESPELSDWSARGEGLDESPEAESALTGMESWLTAAGEEAPPQEAAVDGLPDWLSSSAEEAPTSAAFIGPPDWLQNGENAEQPAGEAISSIPEEEILPVDAVEEGVESPDGEAFITPKEQFAPSTPFEGEELPDWLEQPTPESAPSILPSSELPPQMPIGTGPLVFAKEQMPEWLDHEEQPASQEIESVSEGGTGTAPGEVSPEIEQAEIPDWLQAMRPVEAIALSRSQDGGSQKIEKEGPLAGMRGLVESQDVVSRVVKPPVYSMRLRVTENQNSHAALLENLVSVEARSTEGAKEVVPGTTRLTRMILGILLIAVLLFASIMEDPAASAPGLYPLETVKFQNVSNNLPENAPVLVAFEYDTGLSGELNLSAAQVLMHLIQKQARIAMLSTIPAGPVLAQNLLQSSVVQSAVTYPQELKTVNLGYLPGGIVSLQEFAVSPGQAVVYSLDSTNTGIKAWDHPAVAGISSLTDFACVIVITDNVEVGRAWIEQVQPKLGDVPLLLVSSAQSAPMLQPYLDSGQVKGMITGISGGTAYEQLQQEPGPAARLATSYSIGMLAAVLLIAIGGILQLINLLFKTRRSRRKA